MGQGESEGGAGRSARRMVEDHGRRDAMRRATSRAAKALVRVARWQDEIGQVLADLGRAAQADRISLFRQAEDAQGELVARFLSEWVRPGIMMPALQQELSEFRPKRTPMAAWAEAYARGEAMFSLVRDRPEDERRFFGRIGVVAVAGVPVMVDDRPWGVLSVNMCEEERLWSEAEIELMKIIAELLGAVIGRQEAEERLRAQENELAHAGRVATLGEMAAGLGHELSQPLTSILNRVDACIIALRRREPGRDELLRNLERVATLGQHVGEIVRRIRGFVARSEPRRSRVLIDPLIRDVVGFLRRHLGCGDVRLELDLAGGDLIVQADEIQIRQILINLLLNACDALESLEPARRWIALRTARLDSGGVSVTVSDNGKGNGEENPERFFEPFYTTKPHGLGLGLAICRTIAQAHGGHLRARTREEGGLDFELVLPPHPASGGCES